MDKNIFLVTHTTVIEDRVCQPGWYFWDETGGLGGGPYFSVDDAEKGLSNYCKWLDQQSRPPSGLLAGKKVYLSSPLECIVHDTNNSWHEQRQEVKRELKSRLGLLVHDPYDDLENGQAHKDEIKAAKSNRNFVKLNEIFHNTVRLDLRLVDRADILIAYVPNGVATVGTVHEIVNANNAKKPVFLVEGKDAINVPLWYYGFIPYNRMFGRWEALYTCLKEIDDGSEFADNRISSLQIKQPKGWEV